MFDSAIMDIWATSKTKTPYSSLEGGTKDLE